MTTTETRLLLALIGTVLLCGCSEEAEGVRVFGEVTFQGKPLDQGSIEFSSAEGQGTISGGMIENGRYDLPADHRLKPGKYDVRISSTIAPPERKFGDDPPKVPVIAKQRIPSEYNSKTTLKVELKETGDNKFDFKIP